MLMEDWGEDTRSVMHEALESLKPFVRKMIRTRRSFFCKRGDAVCLVQQNGDSRFRES
jgi:hypothetical protein